MKQAWPTAASPGRTQRSVQGSALTRSLLAAGVAALALWATSANAVTFTFSGNLTSFTVPADGAYQIEAWGAEGGSFSVQPTGGLGAMVGGAIQLHAGDVIDILVGGQGVTYDGNTGMGGGGASWVWLDATRELLLAAGGGGGADYGGIRGGPGQTTLFGQAGGGSAGGPGGAGGQGGNGGDGGQDAGGGSGWFGQGGDGVPTSWGVYGTGGTFYGGFTEGCEILPWPPFIGTCYNFRSGGFGGGGGAGYNGGGGGGGYSGGGGGGFLGSWGGGGGGSYIFDGFYNQVGSSGVNLGDGLVTIASVPEPAAWATMLIGLGGIGAILRRFRRTRAAAS